MELINQHTKRIMEECKVRAMAAGLSFDKETLEYIVTNRDLLELSPKVMIPTLYDYWVNDVEVLKEQGKYKLYPSNPYETVINTRPAVSFYNDNNPDWLNVMIFYHVIAHIDFFQNNMMFENTWDDDFMGQALADKRLVDSLRSRHGRWVNYAIEFSRNMDNIVGYFDVLNRRQLGSRKPQNTRLSFYFDQFLQVEKKVPMHELFREIGRFNDLHTQNPSLAESLFFSEVRTRYPEFVSLYEAHENSEQLPTLDLMEFVHEHSPFLKQEKNQWMKSVMQVVRNTSLYFQPQIRTKIVNEGWASYWHDKLFCKDERIVGHEVDYARINAAVTSVSRIGLNPYAIGLRLIKHVEDLSNKGKLNFRFQQIEGIEARENYDANTGEGQNSIFDLRRYFSDFMLINTFTDQDFVDKNNLFVVGKRLNEQRGKIEYYVKSRKAEDYKKMLIDSLYHPPRIIVDEKRSNEGKLFLLHKFEGKQLVVPFIADTLMGIEYMWGGQVQLLTTEIHRSKEEEGTAYVYKKVLFTMKDRKLEKKYL
jgi:stage V sporulation protein R